MKIFAIIALFTMFAMEVTAQREIRADSLIYCDGKVITVCHLVTGTYVTKGTEKTTFLNFGDFPNQLFTVIIYEEDLKNFNYNPAEYLNGKNVCVTGDVIVRDSGPEIIVESPLQILVSK